MLSIFVLLTHKEDSVDNTTAADSSMDCVNLLNASSEMCQSEHNKNNCVKNNDHLTQVEF